MRVFSLFSILHMYISDIITKAKCHLARNVTVGHFLPPIPVIPQSNPRLSQPAHDSAPINPNISMSLPAFDPNDDRISCRYRVAKSQLLHDANISLGVGRQTTESIERDLLVCALKDGGLLEGVGLLLLHDTPLPKGGVKDSLAEIEPSSHLNLFSPT